MFGCTSVILEMLECPDKSRINSENNVSCFFMLLLYPIDLIDIQFFIYSAIIKCERTCLYHVWHCSCHAGSTSWWWMAYSQENRKYLCSVPLHYRTFTLCYQQVRGANCWAAHLWLLSILGVVSFFTSAQ